MRHSSETFHTLLLLVLLFSGCDLGEPLDSEAPSGSLVNGKSIFLKPNGSFVLQLDVNADAGFCWYHTISDPAIFHLDSTSYRPKSGNWNLDGGMTVETFYFRASNPGQCEVELVERQGWLPDDPPRNAVWFSVHVTR